MTSGISNSPSFAAERAVVGFAAVQGICFALSSLALLGVGCLPGWIGGVFSGAFAGALCLWPRLDSLRPWLTGLLMVVAPAVTVVAQPLAGAAWFLSEIAVCIPVTSWAFALRPRPREGKRKRHSTFRMTVSGQMGALDPIAASVVVAILAYALVPTGPWLVALAIGLSMTGPLLSLVAVDREAGLSDQGWVKTWMPLGLLGAGALAIPLALVARFTGGYRGTVGLPSLSQIGITLPTTLAGAEPTDSRTPPSVLRLGLLVVLTVFATLAGRWAFPYALSFWRNQSRRATERRAIRRDRAIDVAVHRIANEMPDPFARPSEDDTPADLAQKWRDAAWLAGAPAEAEEGTFSIGRKLEVLHVLPPGQARSAAQAFSRLLYGTPTAEDELDGRAAVVALQDAASAKLSAEARERKVSERRLFHARRRYEAATVPGDRNH